LRTIHSIFVKTILFSFNVTSFKSTQTRSVCSRLYSNNDLAPFCFTWRRTFFYMYVHRKYKTIVYNNVFIACRRDFLVFNTLCITYLKANWLNLTKSSSLYEENCDHVMSFCNWC
jgi:hypothetical protein